jgi:hypothetical protein
MFSKTFINEVKPKTITTRCKSGNRETLGIRGDPKYAKRGRTPFSHFALADGKRYQDIAKSNRKRICHHLTCDSHEGKQKKVRN